MTKRAGEQGQLEQALAHYHQAIALEPTLAVAHCNLGNAYRELGQTQDAAVCYEAALAVDPKLHEARAAREPGVPQIISERERETVETHYSRGTTFSRYSLSRVENHKSNLHLSG